MRECWNSTNNKELEQDDYDQILDKLEQKLEYYLRDTRKEQYVLQTEKYEIILDYKIHGTEKKEYITISPNATVKDILDEIYFMISEIVQPYKYLQTWVLLELKTQKAAIISDDVYDWIPAQSVFKMNS